MEPITSKSKNFIAVICLRCTKSLKLMEATKKSLLDKLLASLLVYNVDMFLVGVAVQKPCDTRCHGHSLHSLTAAHTCVQVQEICETYYVEDI